MPTGKYSLLGVIVTICLFFYPGSLCRSETASQGNTSSHPNTTITAIPGISVGHYTDRTAGRGCTVILFPADGAAASVDVRGSAPGTRETDLLAPTNLVEQVHAVLLSGGSAYGLDAASGIMAFLEQNNIGLPVGNGVIVPIVPAAVLFDLHVGDSQVRPDRSWGYDACKNATSSPVLLGSVGAGTGATVGKVSGMKRAMKSGIGSSLLTLPDGILVGALVAVNALGDIIDPQTGKIIAGTRGDKPGTFLSSTDLVISMKSNDIIGGTNTTIGVVATNVPLSKTQLKKIAQMAHDGMARAISPVHTMYDGDTIFAVSVPSEKSNKNETIPDITVLGTAAAKVMEQAIIEAVKTAESLHGYPSVQEWTPAP